VGQVAAVFRPILPITAVVSAAHAVNYTLRDSGEIEGGP
jgi:hypothetical protein